MKSTKVIIGLAVGICLFIAVATIILGVHYAPRALETLGFGNSAYYRTNNVANRYYESGDYRTAISEYSKLIEMRPNKYDGYLLRGMAEYRSNLFGPAIADNTKGLEVLSTRAGVDEIGYPGQSYEAKLKVLPQTQATLYYNRAIAYAGRHDLTHAIDDYTSALSLNPSDANAHIYRAAAYTELKKYPLAIADCNANISQYPSKSYNYYQLGKVYAAMHDKPHALTAFSRAIILNTQQFDYYFAKSQVYEDAHEYANEVNTWRAACDAIPSNPIARGNYGWSLYLNGNFPQAIANDRQTISMDSTASYAYYNLALCYAVQNDWPKAKIAYEDALIHDPSRDNAGAQKDIQNALKLHPGLQALKNAQLLFKA